MNASTATPHAMVLALLLSAGVVEPAHAAEGTGSSASSSDGQPSVAELNEDGARLYERRDYRHAIERFIQAYAVDGDPNLLFNIARCYEELGEVDAAIEKYEAFIAAPGSDARGRKRARQSLSALRDPGRTASAPASAPSSSSSTTVSASTSGQAQPIDGGSQPSRILPWITLGGGIVMAAVGTTFYALGASDHAQVEDADGYGEADAVSSMTRGEAEDLVSSGDTKKLVGGISLGVGGALLATYVVMLATGDSSGPEPQPIGFSLSPDGSGASLSVQGSF